MMMMIIHNKIRTHHSAILLQWRLLFLIWSSSISNILVDSSPRAYPLGCSTEDTTYYDYDNYPFPPPGVPVKTTNDYNILERLGNGKFSDVFSAIEVGATTANDDDDDEINPKDLVVIKCLKPVTDRKIRRELLVLSHASKLPNLARLKAIALHPEFYSSQRSPRMLPRMPSFVLQHAGIDTQFLCHPLRTTTTASGSRGKNHQQHRSNDHEDYLSEYEIKYFLYHLLIALDALHSRGIMHRDVKPRNILITRRQGQRQQQSATTATSISAKEDDNDDDDRSSSGGGGGGGGGSSLMLIDLGLADFYLPNTRYNVRVASRHYKAPELLVGYPFYNYGVDLWPVGCILAGTLFRREPFFRGKDNDDQLSKIIGVLGTQDLISYIHRIRLLQTTTTTTVLSPTIRKLLLLQEEDEATKSSSSPSNSNNNNNNNNNINVGGSRDQQPQSATTKTTTTIIGRRRGGTGRVPWMSFLRAGCPIPSADGLDLLDKLLVYDHDARLTAEEAMAHPFFDDVRDRVLNEMANWQQKQQQQQQ